MTLQIWLKVPAIRACLNVKLHEKAFTCPTIYRVVSNVESVGTVDDEAGHARHLLCWYSSWTCEIWLCCERSISTR